MQLQNKAQSKERKCRASSICDKVHWLGLGVTEDRRQRRLYLKEMLELRVKNGWTSTENR